MVEGLDQIKKYFTLTDAQCSRFEKLHQLHITLRENLNLISRGDVEHLWTRHILHSLSIAPFLPKDSKSNCLDIGTGGGFPSIPLAILLPDYSFVAIDGTQKKIRAVQQIANTLSLTNVKPEAIRAEDLSGTFDFVLARAVAPLPKLLSWSQPLLAAGGSAFFLKGGDLTSEVKAVSNSWKIKSYNLSDVYDDPFFAEKSLLEIRRKAAV